MIARLNGLAPDIAAALERALTDGEIGRDDALLLSSVEGDALEALVRVADLLRARQAGELVTYVVNRNINFTNVCVKSCGFCAFSRDLRSEQGYYLPLEEVVRRATEAAAMGATEVCVQAGLAPRMTGDEYAEIARALKGALPHLHLHAFSPEEVKFGAGRQRRPLRDFLTELKEAGVDTLPGTSAEILDDDIRAALGPGRINTRQWLEVVRTAHEVGLKTTATMMFGHVEQWHHRIDHLLTLRDLQRETGGLTEFVPLSFVHADAPIFLARGTEALAPGPSVTDRLRLYALARLILGASVRNLQVSWVKEGLSLASRLLGAGVNDLGGTLMNESISTAAGARHGQLLTPAQLRKVARSAGRVPAQRSTLYRIIRTFEAVEAEGEGSTEQLNTVVDAAATFGSYAALTQDRAFRYEPTPHERQLSD